MRTCRDSQHATGRMLWGWPSVFRSAWCEYSESARAPQPPLVRRRCPRLCRTQRWRTEASDVAHRGIRLGDQIFLPRTHESADLVHGLERSFGLELPPQPLHLGVRHPAMMALNECAIRA